eukprot:5889385-Amphidinium_carterae.1
MQGPPCSQHFDLNTSWKAQQEVAVMLTSALNAMQMSVNIKKSFVVCDACVVKNVQLQGEKVPKTPKADLSGLNWHRRSWSSLWYKDTSSGQTFVG